MNGSKELLRRLTANDERCLQTLMGSATERPPGLAVAGTALTPKTRTLVQLAALLAVGAPTTSLRWAVELASSTGADEDEIVRVLVTAGPAVGFACVVATAPRLALAIGYDLELDRWEGK